MQGDLRTDIKETSPSLSASSPQHLLHQKRKLTSQAFEKVVLLAHEPYPRPCLAFAERRSAARWNIGYLTITNR